MRLRRIPQPVSNCLSPFSSHFNCPQGQHFRVWLWLLVTLLLVDGSARLKHLTCRMPASLRYWTVRRMVNAGYWNASAAFDELVVATFFTLPPPADGTIYLIADKTIRQKSGKKQPLAHKTRMNKFERFVFGHEILLLIAQWGRLRVPISCEVLDPKRKRQQNILFRQMLRRFRPPAWCRRVVVLADAGFASRPNLRLIQRLEWSFVFAFARSWKLEDGTHLRDLATYLPKQRYRRIASYTPDQRRRDYWVFVRRARLKTVGDVTVILSKRRRNEGPKKVKLIVTNLETKRASEVLNAYARRWAVEVTFKELKSGLHWGQMQVTKEKERVKRAMLLPVMAYVLLLRLYGRDLKPDQGFTIFQLKRRFCEEAWQEQFDRSEAKWRKKLDEIRAET
jgi:Transposase DDE domain